MASLMECPVCGSLVRDDAGTCPECHMPSPGKKRFGDKIGWLLLGCFALFGVLLVAMR